MTKTCNLIAILAALAVVGGCTANEPLAPRYDSGSHWLTACSGDSDCDGLSCECGFCTSLCTGSDECGDALCLNPSTATSCESAEPAICGVLCAGSTDCESGSACVGGLCVRSLPGAADPLPDVGEVGADTDAVPTDVIEDARVPDGGGDADAIGDATGDADTSPDVPEPPELCDERECGDLITATAWRCPDGTPAGELCLRVSEELCEWTMRECPQDVLSCYGSGDCPDDLECNAAELCVADPECPMCDVCFGWCVDPETACSAEECGPSPAENYRCADASLAGPLCEQDGDGVCAWRDRACD